MASIRPCSRLLAQSVCRLRGARLMPVRSTQGLRPWQTMRRQPILLARSFASEGKSAVDEKIEEIQDQYATARDEFEIAMEETEGNTVYAQDDRNAAREEFDKLKEMFEDAITKAEDGEEIQRRIGARIRELENAVKNMEELAQTQD